MIVGSAEAFPYTLTEAVDINNHGQIACQAIDADGTQWAVLLQPVPEPAAVILCTLAVGSAVRRRRAR